MNSIHLFNRQFTLNCKTIFKRRIVSMQRSFSSNSKDDTKDENKGDQKQDEKEKSKEALEKLNKLLMSMSGEKETTTTQRNINLAQPTNKRYKSALNATANTKKNSEKNLVKAVKDVADTLGGDAKQVQSELLQKLLGVSHSSAAPSNNLGELIKGMEIEQSKAEKVQQIMQSRRPRGTTKSSVKSQEPPKVFGRIDLFGKEPLGIFKNEGNEGVQNEIWNELYKKDLKLAVTHPPSNHFQQMILWTEQEKIWKFPIDNEQGLTEEKTIYFAEHIFLEKHLEPWCPNSGPLKHFMELVCVGLSKNPYLTVEAKKEHILWFKNYFQEKSELLKETGAIRGNISTPQITDTK